MGRKISLPENINDFDFANLSKTENKANKRIRLIALEHIKEGKNCTEVASMLKVSIKAVTNWVHRFAKQGITGLDDQEGRGRNPKLEEQHDADLANKIEQATDNLKGGRLFGTDIQKIIKDSFNIECSLSTVYNILSRIDYVWISSRSKHPKSDPAVQEEFKKNSKNIYHNVSQNT